MLEPAEKSGRPHNLVDRIHRWVVIGGGVAFFFLMIEKFWPASLVGRAVKSIWP